MGAKYTGTLRARSRTWTAELLKADAVLVSSDHDVSLDANLQWGQDADSGFLDRFLLPASLGIGFTDPGSVIWDDIRTSAPNSFTIRLTDSTFTYQIDLFCRLADSYTPLKSDTETPVTRLIATCGLNRTKDQSAYNQNNATLHQVFRQLLSAGLHAQDILYLFSTRNTRTGSTGPWVGLLRFPDLEYAYTGLGDNPNEVDTAGNQLTDMAEAFQSMVFNDLHYGRRWCVMQPWLMGITHSAAARNAQLYDRSAGTIDTIDYEGQIVTLDSDVSSRAVDDARRGLFDPDYAVEVEIGSKRDDITEILIQQGSLLQGWIAGGNAFWESSNPNTFHETTEGGYIDDGGETIQQDTLLIRGGKWTMITIDLEYALEYTPGGSGTHQAGFKTIADPLDPVGTTYYSTDGSSPETWTTVDTTQLSNIQTPDANGTPVGSLTWHSYTNFVADYLPEDARIQFMILGDTGNDYYLHLRNVNFELNDQAASAVTDTPPWPAHGTSPAIGGDVTEGPTIKYQRQWHPVVLERTAPNEFVGVEVDTIGTGIWQLPATWEDSSTVGQAGPYADINELIIRQRLARGVGGRLIRGTYKGVLTPAFVLQALGGRYLPIYLSVDLHTEITEFLVYEETLSLAS